MTLRRFFGKLSIRTKLIFAITLTSFATLVLVASAFFLQDRSSIRKDLNQNLYSLGNIIGTNSAAAIAFGDTQAGIELLRSLRVNRSIVCACIYDKKGHFFCQYVREGEKIIFPNSPKIIKTGFLSNRFNAVLPIKLDDKNIGTLFIQADLQELHKRTQWFVITLIFIFLFALLFTFILSLTVQKGFANPILNLAGAAKQVSEKKDYTIRVRKENEDELGQLVDSFNRMLDEIEEHQKNIEKVNLELDSFVYTASHDLRAPLRAIESFAAFLDEDYGPTLEAQAKDYLNEIRRGTRRMNQLIDDLMTLSRVSRIKHPYEDVDMNAVFEDIKKRLEFYLREKKVDLIAPPSLPTVRCDRIKMTEVFVNLVDNAIKFSSKNNSKDPRVEIGYQLRGDSHEFYVRDNGIGIDPQYSQRIFEIFQRLHVQEEYEGTGAGLSIVKRIIEDHGGRIWVESKLGEGATFYFTIPTVLSS